MPEHGPQIGAIVPAAGRSVRMGRPKPLLPLGDTDFIGWILRTLRGAALELRPLVVVRRDGDGPLAARLAELSGPELRVATVPDDGGDMLCSVRAGAALLERAVGALVWPVDVPAVSAHTVRLVGRAAWADPGRVVQPEMDGRPGHPTYVPRRLLAADGGVAQDGLRGLLAAAVPPPLRVSIEDPYSLLNVNTPGEYEAVAAAFATA